MKTLITAVTLGITAMAHAQTTTNTNCNVYGSQVNCTSNTTDYRAQNAQAYQAGAAAGAGIGNLLTLGIMAHRIHSLRDQECHQSGFGSTWSVESSTGGTWSGTCTAKQAGVKLAPAKKQSETLKAIPTAVTPAAPDVAISTERLDAMARRGVVPASFMAHHPEYIQSPENTAMLVSYMKRDILHAGKLASSDDFEAEYAVLKPTGLLKLRH